MQRNTSFFWASDDLRDNNNNGDEEIANDEDNGIDIGWSVPIICEGENDELSEETTIGSNDAPASERIALNQHFHGYGSANNHVNGNGPLLSSGAKVLKSIRFQVVIWHIGTIDVQTGFINMRFRLTLFWNDHPKDAESSSSTKAKNHASGGGGAWAMEGRQRAHRNKWNHQDSTVEETIDVPPVSIMNAVEFETVDPPEIMMVNTQTRSMRWTCMYNAKLFQGDHMSVKDFPHDVHQIKLKLGILAHRGRGGRWDHTIHKLDLANEGDSQGSTRVPHGLVVDHCHVPDFGFDPSDLGFQFIPLMYGGRKNADEDSTGEERDEYLQVTLPVYRQSGHYDTSVLPTLAMLNIIAITCLTRNFGSATAATELMLGIAFVQVGIRLTLDNRLPSVGYQIKMQKVMNCCFWLLCGLVLESNMVFFLVKKRGWSFDSADRIDLATACVALMYNVYIIVTYFRGKKSRPVL
mmetsp:Transcript_7392/g.16758  ORF Transcript_7392/g.16758 Transcript_7392/m.16758 type:complete len:465 (-) Transcript_7392:136-1530(-)|eukprot:CAMPEP_0172312642 /NCGR_PEP_ID=MMETSP1058-20130122/18207_1 /TAXON_ID=83371 /ORGANISM="Detonula confervacea, Strain CCMP 353" /LENGTH=464 /DNA_ID=CAMNT_0013026165 /DNA_START=113 /DNA_END=1507 /DNA_ORIENTATION=+